jgi:sporulation protein YlmC with PRC-barrel domain
MKKLFIKLLSLLVFLSLNACTNASSSETTAVNDIIDYTIQSQDGDSLGAVKDVIFNLESGQVRYVIMELPPDISSYNKAAFVPAAENHVAVPWEALQSKAGTTNLVLTVEDKVVEAAPRLTEDTDDLTEGWDSRVRAYWQENLK